MPPTRAFRFFAYPLVTLIAVVGGFFSWRTSVLAATPTVSQRANQLKILTTGQTINLFGGKFTGGATVASADVLGNGQDEFIVGAGPTGGAQVEVYDQDGNRRGSFFNYDAKMKDGLNVAAGDLTGDGQAEIVVGPQPGHVPVVQIRSVDGKLLNQFTAFESSFMGGVNVAVMPARNGQAGEIVVSSGLGRQAEVRVYDQTGKNLLLSWSPFGTASSNGVSVAAGWSDTFGEPIVVVGAGSGTQPLVKVYGVNSRQVLAQWLAYGPKVKTGVTVAYRQETVMTGAGPGGGPDVAMFTLRGQLMSDQYAFEKNFVGGVSVAAALINGRVIPVAVPTTQNPTAAGSGKKIVVSLSRQELWVYEFDRVISIRKISSGKWSTPTPTGTFQVYNKIPNAYSKPYGLYMEWWMAFTPDGANGLHALPYWKLKNGGKLYEGAAHIGTPVSHGCIRQTLVDAKSLYDWTPIGTPVIIQP